MTAGGRAEAGRWATLGVLAMLWGVAACSADPSPSSTTATEQIAVIAGDAQLADALDTLARPVRFALTDGKGHPLSGVAVTLVVTVGDGSIPQAEKVTDANGQVETAWAMGSIGGVQELEARVIPGVVATATAATCIPGDCYPESRVDSPLSDATLLSLATYDSSGQTVHPDVVHGHGLLSGFWLAITPYPGGDLTHENPSIFHSSDADHWEVPAGVSNPLATPSGVTGYLSDPDILFNPSDQRLWLYYRSYTSDLNTISVLRSSNGSSWDPATVVLTAPAHQVVSPTIVRGGPDAAWVMWAVNAGPQGCSAATTTVERRTSDDGLHWSKSATTDLAQPGQTIWHIDVEWIPARSEYWALYNSYPTGTSCATHALYLARSADGVHWTVFPSPIVRSGGVAAIADIVYRSTFIVDSKGNRVTLWISGARFVDGVGYDWRTATVSTTAAELLAIAATPASSLTLAPPYRALPPPEGGVGH